MALFCQHRHVGGTLWLVWRSSNGVRHISEVKLRQAQLVTTFGGYTIPVFIQATQPGHPSWVGAMSTGVGFDQLWEETAPQKLRPYGAL